MNSIADVREYWDRRPCNIKHSPKPLGTREYFDEVEKRRYFVEPHIAQFAEFDKWAGKKVLEVGCGIGTDSICFARAGADLSVVDISKESLEICRKRFDVYGLKANFYCGDSEELSSFVPIERYDLIYSFGVIHHTPHPEYVLRELGKYADADTEIRLMLYSKICWKVFWIILKYGKGAFWKVRELVREYSEAQTGCPVTFSYTFREIRKLMSNYDIMAMYKYHILPYKIDKYVKYEYEFVWYFKLLPVTIFELLKKLFGWHTMIIARKRQ